MRWAGVELHARRGNATVEVAMYRWKRAGEATSRNTIRLAVGLVAVLLACGKDSTAPTAPIPGARLAFLATTRGREDITRCRQRRRLRARLACQRHVVVPRLLLVARRRKDRLRGR